MGDMRTVFKEARMRGGFSVESSVGLWRIDFQGNLEVVADLESDLEFDFDFFDLFAFGSEVPFELELEVEGMSMPVVPRPVSETLLSFSGGA